MEEQNKRRSFLKYLFSLMAFCSGSIVSIKKDTRIMAKSLSDAKEPYSLTSGIKKIAVEEHFTTETICNYIESRVKAGAKYNLGVGYKASDHAAAFIGDERLREMDKAGIDMQVISPVSFHEGLVDPAEATAASKVTNDETYRIIKKYPKRFSGFAGLACHDPEAAAKELERAVIKLGLKGAMIYSHIQGKYLDDEKFWVIFETAEKLGVPIYLHPKDPSPDINKPYSTYPALAGKIWGYGIEVSLHASRLIGSGLFDRYPGLQIILGHGGESLPFWLWRMGMDTDESKKIDQAEGKRNSTPPQGMPNFRRNFAKQPSEYVKNNFYVTTSGMFWAPVLNFIHSAMGPERVLFAVDYPAESSLLGVQSIESMSISIEDKEKIFHLNTERLLKI